MNQKQFREILDAVENYGDRERIYGRNLRKQETGDATDADVEKRYEATEDTFRTLRKLLEKHL